MERQEINADVQKAKKTLAELIKCAEKGDHVTILRQGQPVVELAPIELTNHKTTAFHGVRTRSEYLNWVRSLAAHVRLHNRLASERRHAAAALRQSEKRFRQVLEAASDGVLEIDREGRILLLNRAAEKMFGYKRDEFLKLKIEQVIPAAASSLYARGNDEKHAATTRELELEGRKKRGAVFPIEIGLSPNLIDGELKTIVVVRDVSERKRTEEAARRSEERLRQAEKLEALARMAGGAAHEFNTLLTMVMGYAALMLSSLDSRENLIDYVEKISKASRRAAEMTRQLLAFSRRQLLSPEELDMNAVVNEARELLPRLVGGKITVAIQPAAQPVFIRADRSQIHQVLLNLVSNARDAMPGGGELTIRVAAIQLDEKDLHDKPGVVAGKYAELAVSDTGVGMRADIQAHLFEPFFSTKEFGKGSGLGLATSYGVVQQSGGNILVESAPGAGATFRVLLPEVFPQTGPSPSAAEIPPPSVLRGSETILLVEDVASLRNLMGDYLHGLGYTVLEAKDGEEAVQKVRAFKGHIHLLLTDVLMPGITGRETADHIKLLRSGIKVLYVSGYIDDAFEKREPPSDPNEAFLEKPFTFEELAAQLRKMLAPGASAAAP
jgi:PAS domain S-box-containing protein